MKELEKWSLLSMETSIFQKDMYPEIDQIDEKIKKRKLYLECIAKSIEEIY